MEEHLCVYEPRTLLPGPEHRSDRWHVVRTSAPSFYSMAQMTSLCDGVVLERPVYVYDLGDIATTVPTCEECLKLVVSERVPA